MANRADSSHSFPAPVTVRDAKSGRDRITMLPVNITAPLIENKVSGYLKELDDGRSLRNSQISSRLRAASRSSPRLERTRLR
jgi:hypothetical protein